MLPAAPTGAMPAHAEVLTAAVGCAPGRRQLTDASAPRPVVSMDILTLVLFVLGIGLLFVGAEGLVRGAGRLASSFGVSALVVGLTVVAFGTSSAELAVSLLSAFDGQSDLAFGNIVGSSSFNILLILGASAVITPLIVQQKLVRVDVPIMIGAGLLMAFMGRDGTISRFDGAVLFILLIVYVVFSIRQERNESAAVNEEYAAEYTVGTGLAGRWWWNAALVVIGLTMLVVGSTWLVDGAVMMARKFGVSELIIGLTIVSIGTSLPELATSILAAYRGERDIAVGTVVGSNIFNILGVLGLTAAVAPGGVNVEPAALNFDVPVMLAAMLACVPIAFTDSRIDRWEGVLLLGYAVAYVAYLVLNATGHDALEGFSSAMLLFVVPLTVVGLVATVIQAVRRGRAT